MNKRTCARCKGSILTSYDPKRGQWRCMSKLKCDERVEERRSRYSKDVKSARTDEELRAQRDRVADMYRTAYRKGGQS